MIRYGILEYYATGEGITFGILLGLYSSDDHIKERFGVLFGNYLCKAADFGVWSDIPITVKSMLPPNITKICEKLDTKPDGLFEFQLRWNRNLS